MNDKARDVIGEVIAEDSVRTVPPSVAQHAVQSVAELQEVIARSDARIEELEAECARLKRSAQTNWNEFAEAQKVQPTGVVPADQDGSNAQISFWAGFEAAVCGLHGVNIRAAWNEFKASEQFARLSACPATNCVTLPEPLPYEGSPESDFYAKGWNDHADAVKTFNACQVSAAIPFGGIDPNFCPGSNPENPQEDDGGVDERETFEEWADEKGFCLDCMFFEGGNNYESADTRLAFDIWMARAALAGRDAVPEGWVIVPERMHLDANVIESINFHCGDGQEDAGFGSYHDGVLWVGVIEEEDGSKTHGLHIATADYPEEGSTTLVEFAATPSAQQQGEKP